MKTTFTLICIMFVQITLAQNGAKKFSASVASSQSAEKSWNLIADIEQWKNWDHTVVDSRFSGPFEEKLKGTMIAPGGAIHEFRLMEVVSGKSYTFSHKLSSGVLYVKRTVENEGSGSKITEEIWFKGISKKTFQKYYGDDFADKQQGKLEKLKSILEGA